MNVRMFVVWMCVTKELQLFVISDFTFTSSQVIALVMYLMVASKCFISHSLLYSVTLVFFMSFSQNQCYNLYFIFNLDNIKYSSYVFIHILLLRKVSISSVLGNSYHTFSLNFIHLHICTL